MNKNLFDIVTLSDKVSLRDPVTIITGGVAVIQSLFPNIFGGGRRRLTESDWQKLIPGAGYWTTELRKYLSNTIHYDSDLSNIQLYTRYFVDINKMNLFGSEAIGQNFDNLVKEFYQILKKEAGQVPGDVPGYIGGGGQPISAYLPYIIGGGVLLLLLTQKKK